jgi:hypothetical protein
LFKGASAEHLEAAAAVTRLRALMIIVYKHPLSIQSDYARTNADVVAMAASLQLITTQLTRTEYSRAWRLTSKGLLWLNEVITND